MNPVRETDAWCRLWEDIRGSGLTPAAGRRRWESQPGLVEACATAIAHIDDVTDMALDDDSFAAATACRATLAAALAAVKEPNNE